MTMVIDLHCQKGKEWQLFEGELIHEDGSGCLLCSNPVDYDGRFFRQYAISNRMKVQGPNLGMPYVRPMGEGIYEIRAKGAEGRGRVFYCTIKGKTIIMLHGFIKKTPATPKHELDIARRRMREVKDERTGKGR